MGYSTSFSGKIAFKTELKASQLADLKNILGEDCRDHPEWGAGDLTHIDYELCDDFSGIQWNQAEKFYDAEAKLNLITRLMRADHPDFELKGELLAQGEDFDDQWILRVNKEGLAERVEIPVTGEQVTCPHCEEKFRIKS